MNVYVLIREATKKVDKRIIGVYSNFDQAYEEKDLLVKTFPYKYSVEYYKVIDIF